jgi:hypothetical protein
VTLSEATASDDRLTALVALRDRLAADLDNTKSARDVASLSQRLLDTLEQIDTLRRRRGLEAPDDEPTGLDEFRQRMADRRGRPA